MGYAPMARKLTKKAAEGDRDRERPADDPARKDDDPAASWMAATATETQPQAVRVAQATAAPPVCPGR